MNEFYWAIVTETTGFDPHTGEVVVVLKWLNTNVKWEVGGVNSPHLKLFPTQIQAQAYLDNWGHGHCKIIKVHKDFLYV